MKNDKILELRQQNRWRKYDLFLQEFAPKEDEKILDVGFANEEYSDVDNFLEKNYPYQSKITALGIYENADLFRERYPDVKVVLYAGGEEGNNLRFPFGDKTFDIGWSNATLEHVGNEEKQILFLKELRRTCKKIYFTTPNRFFPFELHTRYPLIHWLPKKIFDMILNLVGKEWASGDYMYLLSEYKLRKILKKAKIDFYRIHCNKFLGLTVDFSVVIKDFSANQSY